MTLQELKEILSGIPFNDKQIILTLGSKRFKMNIVTWIPGPEPIEIKLEEIKD